MRRIKHSFLYPLTASEEEFPTELDKSLATNLTQDFPESGCTHRQPGSSKVLMVKEVVKLTPEFQSPGV
jgi:hypothetical protein